MQSSFTVEEDITASNATITSLTTTDGITWTGTLTPNENNESTANALTIATSYKDLAQNTATVEHTSTTTYDIDTIAPTAEISIDNPMIRKGETATLTITFAEDVNNFQLEDISVEREL